MRGSGKSTLLARHAALFPRRLAIDPTAEFFGTMVGAYECLTYAETLDALEDAASAKRWTVIACIPPDDTIKLLRILAPESNPRGGYSLAVGGMMIECGEIETIAVNNRGIAPEVTNIFHRGRHYRLSILCATRRPRDVHRIATSQADVIACFRQHEPGDLDYLASVVGDKVVTHIAQLEPYYHVRYLPTQMRASLVNANGVEVCEL